MSVITLVAVRPSPAPATPADVAMLLPVAEVGGSLFQGPYPNATSTMVAVPVTVAGPQAPVLKFRGLVLYGGAAEFIRARILASWAITVPAAGACTVRLRASVALVDAAGVPSYTWTVPLGVAGATRSGAAAAAFQEFFPPIDPTTALPPPRGGLFVELAIVLEVVAPSATGGDTITWTLDTSYPAGPGAGSALELDDGGV